ncbi:MAG: hypothetical protein BMS9Abin05_2346 [Rhodothermia bacterium]|nr:MAG: hypothetical protein BMS9Abin05_2346 [Rhodothermia bacterium]
MRLFLKILLAGLVTLTACTGSKLTTSPIEIDGMNNSVLVGDHLIGGQPSVEALSYLADEGYEVVLSTRAETELSWDERAVVESLGMRFVNIPIPNPVTGITDEQVDLFDEFMKGDHGRAVLHCGSGNRMSGLWAVWLVEREGLSPEEALDLAEQTGMKGIRPFVERRLGIEPEE